MKLDKTATTYILALRVVNGLYIWHSQHVANSHRLLPFAIVVGLTCVLLMHRWPVPTMHAQTEVKDWEIQVANVQNLYAVDVTLTFDTSKLKVEDADPALPGVQIQPGAVFASQPHFVVYNRVTVHAQTGMGLVSFVATLLNPAVPFAGDGVVAIVTYRPEVGEEPGALPIQITNAKVASRDGKLLSVVWQDNVITRVHRRLMPIVFR